MKKRWLATRAEKTPTASAGIGVAERTFEMQLRMPYATCKSVEPLIELSARQLVRATLATIVEPPFEPGKTGHQERREDEMPEKSA